MILQVFRNNNVITSPEIDEQTVYQGEFMGMDKVTAVFMLPPSVNILINDYIEYQGIRYTTKHATNMDEDTGKCTAIFYGEVYDLYDVPMSHLGRTKFSYTGTPLDLLGLLIDCLNDWFGGGWSIGDVELIDEPITFVFDEVSCRVALSDIAERFKLEWYVKDKAFYMRSRVGVVRPVTLSYGKGMGLQLISREAVDQAFATVWRFYGGNKNIPAGYRDGMDRITTGGTYETNVAIYGRKGGSVTFEDVYPRRTSEVETAPDMNTVTDSTIDFDLNAAFITDGGAKIVFKTGELGGNEFVITSYDHATKTIRFGTNKEEDTGYQLPNDNRKAAVGDKYTLIGIEMPQSYVDAAEAEVQARGIAHALQNNHPPVKFPLVIDEKFIREMGLANTFRPGDSFHVFSASLGVDAPMRLQSITFPLVNPCQLDGEISDILLYTVQERIRKDIRQNQKSVSNAQQSALYARQTADEIANAAILHQFKRTYVGERAVMTGAFVAGNPDDGEVAGINGTGSELTEVRFWAGQTFANRSGAPFRVQQNGKTFMTAAEIQDGCKIGSFEIQGGYLRTSDYSSGGQNGVLISDQGISSRNAGASLIPVTSGILIEGSFFGNTNEDQPIPSPLPISQVSAGVIGVKWQELSNQNLQNTGYSRGVYGGFFTSIKVVGGEHKALRWSASSSGVEEMNNSDGLLIVQNNKDTVLLPDTPDHGFVAAVKNARGVDIALNAVAGNDIADETNALTTSLTIGSGEVIRLMFYGAGKRWFVIDRLRKGVTDDIAYTKNVVGGSPVLGVLRVRNGVIVSYT